MPTALDCLFSPPLSATLSANPQLCNLTGISTARYLRFDMDLAHRYMGVGNKTGTVFVWNRALFSLTSLSLPCVCV